MLKLLVADDERILREAVCYLIDWKSIGIELAASCKNGREAYEEACRIKPDIILTDIKMPGLSGLDLVEKLSEPGRVLEFILLTGYADFEYAHRALSHRVHHYLLKPCNEQQIIEVHLFLNRHRQRYDWYEKNPFFRIRKSGLLPPELRGLTRRSPLLRTQKSLVSRFTQILHDRPHL